MLSPILPSHMKRSPPRIRVAAALAMLIAAACTETTTDSADVWTVEEELRIGDESQPEYALTRVAGIAVAENGSMFVLQPDDEMVRVFDRDGRFVNTIGRPGEGPGELNGIVGFGLLGDTLWISDRRGIHRFGLAGNYIVSDVRRYGPPGTTLSPNGPDQVFVDGSWAVVPLFLPTVDRSTWPPHLPVYRVAGDSLLGELARFDLDIVRLYASSDTRMRIALVPFQPLAVYAYAPDRRSLAMVRQAAAEGDYATFRVTRIGFEGDTLLDREVPYRPLPVPTNVRDSIEATVPAELAAAYFRAAPIPSHYPPVQGLTVADDGSFWADLQGHHPTRWLVLDSTGAPRATATAREWMRIFAVRGDRLWGVVRDSLDVPYVVRARIEY